MIWNVILPKFRHHLMLSVDWYSGKTDIVRCHTASFLWHSISLQPKHHKHMSRGFFCGDLCAPKNTRTSANLEQHTFLRMNKQYLAWVDGWLTVAYLHEKQTQTVVKLDAVLSSLETISIHDPFLMQKFNKTLSSSLNTIACYCLLNSDVSVTPI